MLRSIKELHGYTIHAADGPIGKAHDFYFHDDTWKVRYLVVDIGHWLPGRKVLLAPPAFGKPNWEHSTFPVALTREQVEKSPDIDTDKPVSRQQEIELHNHYGWPAYWIDPGTGTWPAVTPMIPIPPAVPSETATTEEGGDSHLRSTREIAGYHIHARNGDLGHVGDFIVDDEPWAIRYVVVHTGKWLPGKKVLVATEWVEELSYPERRVSVNLTRAAVEKSPEFDPAAGVNRQYEERLYDYYGRPAYWAEPDPAAHKRRRYG